MSILLSPLEPFRTSFGHYLLPIKCWLTPALGNCRKVAERNMNIEDLQDVAQLRVIVTMKEGHDSNLYGTGEYPV